MKKYRVRKAKILTAASSVNKIANTTHAICSALVNQSGCPKCSHPIKPTFAITKNMMSCSKPAEKAILYSLPRQPGGGALLLVVACALRAIMRVRSVAWIHSRWAGVAKTPSPDRGDSAA